MKILGIDASMKTSSAAVAEYDSENSEIKILASAVSDGTIPHSENLLPMIDSTLKSAGLNIDDIDCFAVIGGPGSFTGIRIGVATIKGLAFGRGSCCVGISTLDALFHSISPDKIPPSNNFIVAPLIDARRNQAYNALYLYNNGSRKKIVSDRIILLPDLLSELESSDFSSLPVYFCGDVKPEAVSGASERFNFIPFGNIAEAACRAAIQKTFIHPNNLSPRYLIKTQAEREYMERGEKNI